MLTITDFINILHRYYKSALVRTLSLQTEATALPLGPLGLGFPLRLSSVS